MSDVDVIYKICPRKAWEAAVTGGRYVGSADDARDGFIHMSTLAQLAGTAARHFRGQPDLVIVALAVDRMGPALRWEPSRGGAMVPHLYGPLDTAAALFVRPLPLGDDGVPVMPEDLA